MNPVFPSRCIGGFLLALLVLDCQSPVAFQGDARKRGTSRAPRIGRSSPHAPEPPSHDHSSPSLPNPRQAQKESADASVSTGRLRQAERPYDLPRDLGQRSEEAKDDLGANARSSVVGEVFVLAAPRTNMAFSRALSVVEQTLDSYFNDRFSARPARAISIYLFSSARSYNDHCRALWETSCSTPYGFYLPTRRRIVLNAGLGIGTLTHELVHPIVETDFPEAPTWIDEGLASLFERFGFPSPGEIRGYKNWRHPRLLEALNSSEADHATLPTLFGLTDAEFRNASEDLHYAMARYFCQWMDHQGKLWPFYRQWREHFRDDPTGVQSFQENVGMTPAEAQRPWAQWVRRL